MATGGNETTKPVMPFYSLNVKAEEKIRSLESKWQVHFDWLRDVVEEAKVKYAKPGEERELSLLPQTPGPKRGRRKRGSQASQEEPSSKRIDLDTTATKGRGGRAAAKAAQQRIANDVEEMANLAKKKRRPTALSQDEDTSVSQVDESASSQKNGSRVEFMDQTSDKNDSIEDSNKSVEASQITEQTLADHGAIIEPITNPTDVTNEETVEPVDNSEAVNISVEPNEEVAISSPQHSNVVETAIQSDETFENNDPNATFDAPIRAQVANATFTMDNSEDTNEDSKDKSNNEAVNGTFVLERQESSADEAAANETFDKGGSMSVDEDETHADNEAEMEDINEEKKRKSLRKKSSMGPPRTSSSRPVVPDSEDERTPVKKSRRSKSLVGESETQPLANGFDGIKESVPVPSPRKINSTKEGISGSSQDESTTSTKSTRTKQKQNTSDSSGTVSQEEEKPSRSTRTKQKQNTSASSQPQEEEKPSRSTRTKQKQNNSVSSEPQNDEDGGRPSRSTRTKQKQNMSVASDGEERPNSRSTRTKQKDAASSDTQEERPPSRSTRTKQKDAASSDTQEERPPSRSTRTKQKALPSSSSLEEESNTRSSRSKQKAASSVSSDTQEENERPASRSTRTKQKIVQEVDPEERPTRSTRTKQKQLQGEVQSESGSKTSTPNQEAPEMKRSTRTKQKLLSHNSQSGSGSEVTGTASPRVRELVARAMSPSKARSNSPRVVGYTGSPVMERVQVFEKAMRDSAGLKSKEVAEESAKETRATRQSKSNLRSSMRKSRKSSITSSLMKVSAARRQSVVELLETQEVSLVRGNPVESPTKKGPVIRKSPGTSRDVVNTSRAPAGKVVKPMRGTSKGVTPVIRGMTPGSRGVTPGGSSRMTPGSAGSHNGGRVRSRLGIMEKNNKATPGPGNMVARGGVTSFLPQKPKGPTLDEIQEQKEDERKRKEEKAAEALKKKEEQMKKKIDEQREKREERIRRVQEARKAQENEAEMKRNQAKETEEKLAALAKREKKAKEEAEKKRIKEARLKEAEERKAKEEEARLAKIAHQEELKNRETAEQERKMREEEERKRRMEQAKREEEEKRREKERKKEEERRLQNDLKKREAERIAREKEELNKIKMREAEKEKEKNELNSTYTKPADTTLNQTKDAGPSSYDMTPSRHGGDLPPEPLENENNYGLDDLDSEGSTDNEDAPRKEVPKWAEGALLRTALLKQCYMCPDLDALFDTIDMPDLSEMFAHQRKRFYKRTSSAQWDAPPSSFKLGNRW